MKRTIVLIITVLTTVLFASCSTDKLKGDLKEYGTGENESYTYITFDDKVFIPFSAVDNSRRGDQIGIVNGDKKDKIYEFKGFPSDEWIIEYYDSGEMDGSMLLRETSVTEYPEGIESEYAWNQESSEESIYYHQDELPDNKPVEDTHDYDSSENETDQVKAISSEIPNDGRSSSGEADPIGLTMSTENITETGCTLVFNQSGGDVTGELQTGPPFELQKMNTDGEWINDIKAVVDWVDIAYIIKKNGTTEIKADWQYIHDALDTGRYRIKKEVMDFRRAGDYDTYEIYAEFDFP